MYGAVDIGGTKTLIAVYKADGEVVAQQKFPTPQDFDEFITTFTATYKELGSFDLQRAVVAVPGQVDRKHGIAIAFGNLPWTNVPMAQELEKILNCPVQLENDANLAGLSEALLLKDQYRKVVYVTVSTGIGGVLVVDGEIDPNTADAEIGHILLEHNGQLMRWEQFASGKAIVAKYGKRVSDIEDPTAWYGIARNIAIGLIDVVAVYVPEVIVLGGGVGTNFDKFSEHLLEQMKIYDNPMLTLPVIIKAQRPEEAVIYGCYHLAKTHHAKLA